ncbi:MAG: tetratricopeptide repeat protein [Brevinema sp.]
MIDFLIFLCVITMIAIISSLIIRIFVVRPGQVSRIQHFIEDGKLEEALLYIQMRLKHQPKNAFLGYWLGEILWMMGRKTDAINAFENVDLAGLKYEPQYLATLFFRLGLWYCNVNRLEDAEVCFKRLVKTKINHPDFFYARGMLALRKNQISEALDLFTRALQLDNSHSDTLFELGNLYIDQKEFTNAHNTYIRLAQLHPTDPEIWLKLASIAISEGNTSKAIRYFNKVETFSSSIHRFKAASGLAKIYMETGDNLLTIQALLKAIAYAKPEFCPKEQLLEIHYDLAEMYIDAEDVDQAIKQWEIILETAPEFRDVSSKYAEFRNQRMKDLFKDLLTLNETRLINRVVDFVRKQNVIPQQYQFLPEGCYVVATSDPKFGGVMKLLYVFWCSSENLPRSFVSSLQRLKDELRINRIILFSPSPVLSDVRDQIRAQDIQLFDEMNVSMLVSE